MTGQRGSDRLKRGRLLPAAESPTSRTNHLGAEVEIIPVGRINEAYERILASDVRYRFVIDNSTLT
jgi:hypothetical protein